MLDVSLGEMPPCDAGKRANGGGAKLHIGLEGEALGAQTGPRSQQPPQAGSISHVSHIRLLSSNYSEKCKNEEKHAWLERTVSYVAKSCSALREAPSSGGEL